MRYSLIFRLSVIAAIALAASWGLFGQPPPVEATHNATMYAVTTTSISFWEVNPSTGSRTSPAACVINSPPGRPDVYGSSSNTLYAYLDDNDKFYEIDIDACTISELFTISDIDRDFNGAAFVGGALYATELSGSSTIPLYTINSTNGAGDVSGGT